jgi:hypothetical protein
MAQENFNVSFPNDGLGDDLRNAFIKQQAMNTELYSSKVDKVTGQGLSENNFTNSEKIKLSGIQEGAEVNVQADWNQTDDEADDFIKNKPEINSIAVYPDTRFDYIDSTSFIVPENVQVMSVRFNGTSTQEVGVDWSQSGTTVNYLNDMEVGDFLIISGVFVIGSTLPTTLPNRTVKLVTAEAPYVIEQSDDNKFLTITTEFDPVLSLGFTANTEFWIKNTSPTPREVLFDTDIEFIGSPLIPTNGLAILKLIEVVDDVEYWSVNHLLANGTPSGGGGELIKITEGGNTGYRLKGFNPDNYGDIGQNAIDLSFSTGASSTRGATGIGATAEGRDTTASGDYSHAKGYESRATGLVSFAKGYDTIAEGESSHAEGQSTRALGNQSHAEGLGNFARATGEHSGGIYGTDYEPLNNGTDRLVNYGNGTSSVKRDAFTIFRNGAVRIFRATLPSITNAMSGMLIFDSGNSNRPTIHNGTEWKALAYLSDLPFANIQTSSFTAVNLVAYSTNGTLTVTDPDPETNKGYIVHVVGGTTTINGVGYTAGALVYRFYDGTDWTSKNYGASGSSATNLGYTPSPTNGTVTSSTGTDAIIPLADGTNAGLLSPTEKSIISNLPLIIANGSVSSTLLVSGVTTLLREENIGSFSGKDILKFDIRARRSITGNNSRIIVRLFDTVTLVETEIAISETIAAGNTNWLAIRSINLNESAGNIYYLNPTLRPITDESSNASSYLTTSVSFSNPQTLRIYGINITSPSDMVIYSSLIQVL